MSILLSFLSLAFANSDCDPHMGLRSMLPHQENNVPLNARIWISMIGNGTADFFDVQLKDMQFNSIVSGTLETNCYDHESDTEFHCNYAFVPDDLLATNRSYQIMATATALHQQPNLQISSTFTTGSGQISIDPAAPALQILSYDLWTGVGVDECDWVDAYHYELLATVSNPDQVYTSLLQVYEVDSAGVDNHVHTLFVNSNQSEMDFRQVIEPGTEYDRCYRVVHEDMAGNATDSSPTVCYGEPVDSGLDTDEQTNTETETEETATETETETYTETEYTDTFTYTQTSEPSAENTNPEAEPTNQNSGGGAESSVKVGSSGCSYMPTSANYMLMTVFGFLMARRRGRISQQ